MRSEPANPAGSGIISTFEVRDLEKAYDTGQKQVHALRGVSFSVAKSEMVVLLGPSGSGKSTLLNLLGGLDRPTAGSVLYDGIDLATLGDRELTDFRRERIGFIFQSYNLIPSLTAEENVRLVTDIADEPLDAGYALELVGLGERRHHFPAQLSGGEQQRVAVARAIAKRPGVLLCDEPTGALDSATGARVLTALREANRELDTTVVVITHNISIAKMADRVFHFRDGLVSQVETNAHPLAPELIEW